jgi:hypothetical protein
MFVVNNCTRLKSTIFQFFFNDLSNLWLVVHMVTYIGAIGVETCLDQNIVHKILVCRAHSLLWGQRLFLCPIKVVSSYLPV